jgi:hypothetical protein
VAPGIDVDRDILPYMDFEPIIGEYGEMDARIFNANPMGLEAELLNLSLPERVIYDPERNILFLNFEGMHVRVVEDVQAIWDICELRCRAAGKRVGVIINYDRFRINQDMYDAYAEMDRYFLANYFSQITRYATSAFLRAKLGEAFSARSIAPHIFERREEAQAFLAGGRPASPAKKSSCASTPSLPVQTSDGPWRPSVPRARCRSWWTLRSATDWSSGIPWRLPNIWPRSSRRKPCGRETGRHGRRLAACVPRCIPALRVCAPIAR